MTSEVKITELQYSEQDVKKIPKRLLFLSQPKLNNNYNHFLFQRIRGSTTMR